MQPCADFPVAKLHVIVCVTVLKACTRWCNHNMKIYKILQTITHSIQEPKKTPDWPLTVLITKE